MLRTGFAFRGARLRPRLVLSALLATAFLVAGCSDSPTNSNGDGLPVEGGLNCSIPLNLIQDGGVGLDGIPALTDPATTGVWAPETEFLEADDRVIGLELGGEMIAIPHRVLWWHEIVNLNRGEERVAVTYCPLTGSSMVYDRSAVDGAEFGVSGLLLQNNLIMYDRGENGGSLWPQMMREARCGDKDGTGLPMVAATEIRWDRWRELNPDGQVVVAPSSAIGTPYDRYPYGDYEDLDNSELLYPQSLTDFRRPTKERVLGIPDGPDGGKAYPFGELSNAGSALVINDEIGGDLVLVLWDSSGEGAYAYRRTAAGQVLTFSRVDGRFVDDQTGSVWGWDGVAFQGQLEGTALEPIDDAFVAFWFTWSSFQPLTNLWEAI